CAKAPPANWSRPASSPRCPPHISELPHGRQGRRANLRLAPDAGEVSNVPMRACGRGTVASRMTMAPAKFCYNVIPSAPEAGVGLIPSPTILSVDEMGRIAPPIFGSVGRGGTNAPGDVFIIQSLLNDRLP